MTSLRKGWYRLGIALTTAWLLSVGAEAMYEWRGLCGTPLHSTPFYFESIFFDISVDNSHRGDAEDPNVINSRFRRAKFFRTAVVPVAAVWIIVLVLMPTARWVRDGFKT
jgi:hypothetical protein